MTEGQRDTDEARLQLQAAEELAKLTARLRQEMPATATYTFCGFCAKLVRSTDFCCPRCGWKVAS